MQTIGRKIYYNKLTGDVLLDTGERTGNVCETTREEDFQTYKVLAERTPETVGCLQLEYGQDRDKFNQYRYHIDLVTETIVWEPYPIESNLDDIKTAKIAFLNEECTQAIYAGFTSTSTGYTFKFDLEAQDNFNQQCTLFLLNQNLMETQWKTENAGIITLTKQQFIDVVFEAAQHKQTQIAKYWQLKAQVNAATTKEEVDAINW